MHLILPLLTSHAIAADPTTVASPPAPPVSHITVTQHDTNALAGAQNIAVSISCTPTANGPTKFQDLPPALTDYRTESVAFLAAMNRRSDVSLLVDMNNATSAEILDWFKTQAEITNEPVRMLFIAVSCPAWGGDTDEEELGVNGAPLAFADLLTAAKPLAMSSVTILDASRNVSAALDGGSASFGPTADDVVKDHILPDAFAISSSAPGKYGGPGLIGAVAKVIDATNGGQIDLNALYYLGVKAQAPTSLELFTSMGVVSPDTWNGNTGRLVLPGGKLITPPVTALPPAVTPPKRNTPKGCWVAGGGAAVAIAGSIFAVRASDDYDKLKTYNKVGGESQTELDEAVKAYRTDLTIGVAGLGLGVLAIAGGTTWTVIEEGRKHHTEVTITPTGNGVMVGGTF